jgi:FkbM family methyltransferase
MKLDSSVELSVYDIGAHKGEWALEWLKYHPNSKFVLFEANNSFNSRLTQVGKVFNVVLGDKSKKVKFFSINATGDSYYKENSIFYEHVIPKKKQVSTLDEIVSSENLLSPDIIKIDTQGSELDILLGASKTIKNALILIIECRLATHQNMSAPGVSEVIKFLEKHGFQPFKILEIHTNQTGLIIEIDIVFKNERMK